MYEAFSGDYDRFVNWPDRLAYELPFLETVLGAACGHLPGCRVLDAACGTGMHAVVLARRGCRAAGADSSAGMVARARDNAAAAGVEAVFLQAGFGELAHKFATGSPPVLSFDALLCLGNSLPHLLTREDVDRALADFAACLRPGGAVIIQNRNFDAVMASQARWMEPQAHREDGQEWIFLRFYDFDPDGLLTFNIITLQRADGQAWQQRTAATRLQALLKDELVESTARAGFEDLRLYGDMQGNAFDPESSGNLILVASKSAHR